MTDPQARLATALADRYQIERELGAGGMATVYLAEDLKHHRKVAVKVLRPDLAAALGPERFLREVTIAANLQHPHVLPLYDSGQADGFLYYVMPFVDGVSLRERLVREGEFPIPDAVRILRDVADAMAYSHSQGVVHRDIKPENIMLSGRHALVTDFGVAKAVSEATGRRTLTTAGVALGTPTYMSPEQAAADPHTDHRADIYAFGVVAYELLTGMPPFVGATPQAVLSAHIAIPPMPVTNHRASIPPALAGLVMRCLEKKPADRWQRADDLIPQLEAVLTPSGGITPVMTEPVRAVMTGRGWKKVAAVMVLLAAVGATGWYLTHRPAQLVLGRIAIGAFENRTGDPTQDGLAESMAARVAAAIGREGMDVVRVAATSQGAGAARRGEVVRTLFRRTGAEVVVVMTAQAAAGGVVYGAELLRMPDGKPIVALDPTPAAEPDVFTERLLVALVMNRESGSEFAWQGFSLPSKLASFEEVRRGDELWAQGQIDEAIGAMRQAWQEDSTWFTPVLREAEMLLNPWTSNPAGSTGLQRDAQADAVLRRLEVRRSRLLSGDRTYLEWLRARRSRQFEPAYQLAGRLAARMPLTWGGVRAVEAYGTLRPEEAVRSSDSLRASNYWSASARRRIDSDINRGSALHMLGRFEEELALAQEIRRLFPGSPTQPGITVAIMARAGLRQAGEVERLVSESEGLRGGSVYTRALIAAMELRAHGETEGAERLYARAIAWHQEHTPLATANAEAKDQFANAYFEAGKWREALEIYQGLEREVPSSESYLTMDILTGAGAALAQLGRRDEALRFSQKLAAIRQPDPGASPSAARGCIAASLGDKAGAVELFRRAAREGWLPLFGIHRERCYDGVRGYPAFEELIRPKG